MSRCYWINEGIGVDSDTLLPHLDKHKCFLLVKKQLPDEEISEDDFDLDDFFYGCPFENLGDFMCHADDSEVMTYGDNGDGVSYFLYPKSYPWHRHNNEPRSIAEVHNIIIDSIQKVTNLSTEEADKLIDDDIYELGEG